MTELNATHDPNRRSIVGSANVEGTDFPIQNLPFGMFRRSVDSAAIPGIAIGDRIIDLRVLQEAGALHGVADTAAQAACRGPALNALLALGNDAASALRYQISDLLDVAGPGRFDIEKALVPMSEIHMQLPAQVGNFTDFLTSGRHFMRMRPDGALSRTFMSLPIAYHSRASSVRVGGDIIRPHVISESGDNIGFAPSTQMDYELELGAWVGWGNGLGDPIRIGQAKNHIFGFSIVNDWSVRDAQWFESQPLGPFLSKSVSTTVSPWIITEEAMRPFRSAALRRGEGELAPLAHLQDARDQGEGALDIALSALLLTPKMRAAGDAPVAITQTNSRHLYWTLAQMLTHHSSNGCNMMPGDLFASGTVSGPANESRACLAEINQKGTVPLTLPSGESRIWLEDGDEVILTGRAERPGFVGIGFGWACGQLVAARPY